VIAGEVLGLQPPAKPLFQATDTQAPALWFHAGTLPDGVADLINFTPIVEVLRHVVLVRKSLFQFRSVETPGSGMDAAINAQPALGQRLPEVFTL
jgi:hypothetical protein